MQVAIEDRHISIKGNTFPHKDFFKSSFGATWNPSSKEWLITPYGDKQSILDTIDTYLNENGFKINPAKSIPSKREYTIKRAKTTFNCSYCGEEGHRSNYCEVQKRNEWSKKERELYFKKMFNFFEALYEGKYCKCNPVSYSNFRCQWNYYRKGFNQDDPFTECFCQLSPLPSACSFCEFACCKDCKTKKDAIGCYATECPTHGIHYDTRGT